MTTMPDRTDPAIGWRMWSLIPAETPPWSAQAWALRSPFLATTSAGTRHVFWLRGLTGFAVFVRTLRLLGGAVRRRRSGRPRLCTIVFATIRVAGARFEMCHRPSGWLGPGGATHQGMASRRRLSTEPRRDLRWVSRHERSL